MDFEHSRDVDPDRKKQKKKKHDRSRSLDKKKKKKQKDRDRDESRDNKKKDKQKKTHRERSRSIDRSRDKKEKGTQRDRKEKRGSRDRQVEKSRPKDYDRYDKQRERQRQKKHKDRRQRSRSRSRSKDRKKKSDERYKKYQKEDTFERWKKDKDARFRFDSPPKSDDSMESQDPEKMNKLNKMKAEKQLVSSKADRKLYLGNLPPNITSNQLMVMLNTALKKMEINTDSEGDSIISAWVSPDGVGHYAFVEFRSAQEATAGLALNGASLYGYQLKLGRPKQYIQYQKQLLSEFGSDGNIDTIIRKVEAMGGFSEPIQIEQRLVYPPSRVVVLKHIVTVEELSIDEEYREITQDVMEMAQRHGDVIQMIIPRPTQIDLEVVKTRVKGLGNIFIKYKTLDQGRYARKEFIKQMFSDRSVSCGYFSQTKLDQGELDVIEKIMIDF